MARFCSKCGRQFEEGEMFCAGCGARRPVDEQQARQFYAAAPVYTNKKKWMTVLIVVLSAVALMLIVAWLLNQMGDYPSGFDETPPPLHNHSETLPKLIVKRCQS